ncbi:hypothetical protein LguiB_014356 [Lonicera macranthoides]
MPGGGFGNGSGGGSEFEAKITPIVIISCFMAATGGLMFGYDIGISEENLEEQYLHIAILVWPTCTSTPSSSFIKGLLSPLKCCHTQDLFVLSTFIPVLFLFCDFGFGGFFD